MTQLYPSSWKSSASSSINILFPVSTHLLMHHRLLPRFSSQSFPCFWCTPPILSLGIKRELTGTLSLQVMYPKIQMGGRVRIHTAALPSSWWMWQRESTEVGCPFPVSVDYHWGALYSVQLLCGKNTVPGENPPSSVALTSSFPHPLFFLLQFLHLHLYMDNDQISAALNYLFWRRNSAEHSGLPCFPWGGG